MAEGGHTADGTLVLGKYKIQMANKLGQGTFGVVYPGNNIHDGTKIAAKQCELKTDEHGGMALREIKHFHQLVDNPNIVKMLDFHFHDKAFWIVMEFCDEGDLTKFMVNVNPPEDIRFSIMYQCASAIHFMHTRPNPVVHRDIKPANIMMKTSKDLSAVLVKVTDFGLSKIVDIDPNKTVLFTTAAGTPGFMAPEFFFNQKYGMSVDVFALGLVFLAIVNFTQGDLDLLPVAASAKKARMIMPVGMVMVNMHSVGQPMPRLFEDNPNDSEDIKTVKKLVEGMTAFEGKDRTPLATVEQVLQPLGASSVPAVPASKKPGKSLKAEKNKDGPPRIQTQTSRVSGSPPRPPDEGEIGFQLLKEALEQALNDMSIEGDKQKVEKQLKDIPFTSLLAQVLGDKRQIDKFDVGDQVVVDSSVDRAKDLQKGHGEWNDDMVKYLGHEGKVKDKILHVVRVEFPDGQCWNFNPELLHKPGESSQSQQPGSDTFPKRDIVAGIFKRYDVVKLPDDQKLVESLQKGHGGWNPKMKHCLGIKGIVNRIDRDGDVYIECINGDNWTFNPEILTHVDMSGEHIEAGDFVIIKDDKQLVRQLQEHHGGWVDSMNSALGKSGIVQSVEGDRAKVESKSRSFIWNTEALIIVAKGEEMLKAVLRKKTK